LRSDKSPKKRPAKLSKKLGKKLARNRLLTTIGQLLVDVGASEGVPSSTGSQEPQAQTDSKTRSPTGRPTKKGAAPSVFSTGAAVGRKGRPSDASVPREESSVKLAKSARLPRLERLAEFEARVTERDERRRRPGRTRLKGARSYTDLNNADVLACEYGQNLKFCEEWNKWVAWNGKCWVRDKSSIAKQAAIRLALEAMEEVEEIKLPNEDDPEYKKAKSTKTKLEEVAKGLQSGHKINTMIQLASCHSMMSVATKDFDSDPWLFNAANGTINLRDGSFYEHRRSDMMMKIAGSNSEYNSDLTDQDCSLWMEFINDVTCGDRELATYLQRIVGYIMTGDVSERALFIFYGLGSNGKGTFLRVLQEIMGDYAQPAPQGMLEENHSDDHPSRVASLHGCRLAVCSEVERGRKLAESMVKDLTGGDRLAARRMREDFWYFYPQHKLILQVNYRPIIVGDDYGIWSRVHMIPWNAKFSDAGDNQIRNLYEILLREASGILAWMVRGCMEWQRIGLKPPPAVLEDTQRFMKEMNHVEDYVNERLRMSDGSALAREEIREDYELWATARRYQVMFPRDFVSQLRKHIEKFGAIEGDQRITRLPYNYPVRAWKNIYWADRMTETETKSAKENAN